MKILDDLRVKVPKINFVLPIVGEQFGIIANVKGGADGLPECVKMDVKGKTITIFLSTE